MSDHPGGAPVDEEVRSLKRTRQDSGSQQIGGERPTGQEGPARPRKRIRPTPVDPLSPRPQGFPPPMTAPWSDLIARIEAEHALDRGGIGPILPCTGDTEATSPVTGTPAMAHFRALAPSFIAPFTELATREAILSFTEPTDEEMVEDDEASDDPEPDDRDENDASLIAEEVLGDQRILELLKKREDGDGLTEAEQAELDDIVISLDDLPALTVDFLDVGQGDSTLFVCDDGTTMMIDLGSVNSGALSDPAKDSMTFLAQSLHRLMKKRGLDQPCIDRFYITHCDRDHYNLLPSLYKAVKEQTGKDLDVKKFYITEEPSKYTSINNTTHPDQPTDKAGRTDAILKQAQRDKRLVIYKGGYAGDDSAEFLNEEKTVSVRTLCANSVESHAHPRTGEAAETASNMSSIVVLVEVKPTSGEGVSQKVLMMGDAESVVENRLLALHPQAVDKSTILHVGHHGSRNAAQPPFLEKVNPRVAQFSADMKWQHPYDETVRRLTDNPKLRVNESGEGDVSHPIVVELPGDKVGHQVRQTRSGVITNLTDLQPDTSNSELAQQATAKALQPTLATGEQWRVVFSSVDGSYMKYTNARYEEIEQIN